MTRHTILKFVAGGPAPEHVHLAVTRPGVYRLTIHPRGDRPRVTVRTILLASVPPPRPAATGPALD